MKNRIVFTILIVLGIALGAMVIRAQSSTSPTDGTTVGNYVLTTDAELGVRFRSVDGDFEKYRSDLNYGRGFRLFNVDFLAKSKDGHGKLFDTFRLSALGWGGDPSQYLRIEVEKNKWYRFDSNFRQFAYFNDLTNIALNQHQNDIQRKFGDFNLTLLPDNEHFKAHLGYTLEYDNGVGISTYDYQRNEFPLLAPTRDQSNDFRGGFDARILGVDISFMQGYRHFKDDSTYSIPSLENGNEGGPSAITYLDREIPTRGSDPWTRFSAHTLIAKKLDFTGRFAYSSSKSNYDMTETIQGTDASNNNVLLDLYNSLGAAKQHNGMGDFGVSFFATDRLTISDTFRVNDFQISGGSPLSELLYRTRTTSFGTTVLPVLAVSSLSFRFLGYRQFLNTLEGDYRIDPRLSVHLGYRHNNLRTDVADSDQPPASPLDEDIRTFHTNSVFGGFSARPVSIWTVYFDIDHGTSDNVFTRISNFDYTNVRVRTRIKATRTLAINGSFISRGNRNPTEVFNGANFTNDITTRNFSTSVDWLPSTKFSLSGGYTLNHVNSDASIIFFLSGVQTNGDSLYYIRNNYFFFNSRVQILPRATLFVAYRISKDLGQGDRVATSPTEILSSYPLSFQSPDVRLTVKLTDHIAWNAGWQYYNYHETLVGTQNYHANLPYTSLRFTF